MLNFFNLVITDIKISFRKKNESIISVLFFLFSILILPLIFQGDQEIIKKFLVGIVWFLTLLTIIFSVEKLFENDYEDGILDQIPSCNGKKITFMSKAKLRVLVQF